MATTTPEITTYEKNKREVTDISSTTNNITHLTLIQCEDCNKWHRFSHNVIYIYGKLFYKNNNDEHYTSCEDHPNQYTIENTHANYYINK